MLRSFLMTLIISGFVVSIPVTSTNAMDVDSRHLSRQVKVKLPQNVAKNFDRAETALLDCDEGAFNRAMNNLREQQESLEKQAKQKNITPWNTEEQMAKAHEYAENIAAARESLQKSWKLAQPCDKPQEDTAGVHYYTPNIAGFEPSSSWGEDDESSAALRYAGEFGAIRLAAAGKSGGSYLDVPGFLGTEVSGSINTRVLGVIEPENNGSYVGYEGELRYGLGEVPNFIPNVPNVPNVPNYNPFRFWDFFLGYDHASASFDTMINNFNTGGRDLLIVGNGAGPSPSGFVVPAANSAVTNIVYNGEYDFGGYEIGLGKTVFLQNVPNVRFRLRPFVGLRYGHYDAMTLFRGTTNAGTLDFAYHTDITNHSIGPFVGTEFAARPKVIEDIFGGTPIEIGGLFRYGYDFNDLEGSNILSVTGALNQSGRANLDEDSGTHNFKTELDVTLFPDSPFNVKTGVGWERVGNGVNVTGDGTGLFNAGFQHQDNLYGKIGVNFNF